MPRAKVTSRFRGTDMFSRRIVISIPRTGVLIIAGSVAFGLMRVPYNITNIIAVITSVVAVATIVEARWQLRTFRYEMSEKIAAALGYTEGEEGWIPEEVPVIEEGDDNTTSTELRLPARRRRAS